MNEVFVWLTFAVVQVVVVSAAFVSLRRGQHSGSRWNGPVLLGSGTIVVLADLAWVATGGLAGESFIGMRGGVLGFWLSLLTGLEIMGLGLLHLVVSRRDGI